VADKQTCHVTHAHWCVRDPRSGARARLPVSFFDAKKKETRKDDHGKGTRRVLFFSDLFLSASSSSLDALKRSISKVVHRDKNAIASSFQNTARAFEKEEEEEKKERGGGGGEKGGAQTKTHRLETSLFGAVTRTDWAAAVWVKENIFVVVVLVCVLKSEDYTRVLCTPFSVFALKFL